MDGEVFIEPGKKGPPSVDLYKGPFQELSDFSKGQIRAVRKLAHWKDPTTIPHSRAECVKMCQITPWDKWCCGWKIQWQWMYCDLYLEVDTQKPQDIVDAIESCLSQAAIAAAVAGIVAAVVTGGGALAAAEAAFISKFTPCIESKLQNIITIKLYQSCGWGPWE